MVPAMQLTMTESRVLGALLEKAATTPEQYPLSSQALVTACNQSQNRDPVMQLSEVEVIEAVYSLREWELIRSVKRPGERVMKHQHDVDRRFGLDEVAKAVLAVLLLRGPQTPGELRTRIERYVDCAEMADVHRALEALAAREIPLTARLDRRPGQKEERWTDLLNTDVIEADRSDHPAPGPAAPGSVVDRLTKLEEEVEGLRAELTLLRRSLGELP